jgi:3-deoxy-D-manno-octulosonic-acid transferase
MYQLIMWLLWPLWVYYSFKRCHNQENAWDCWSQLWTIQLPHFQHKPLWIHAVSLGETQAAFILIRQLRHQHPNLDIYFTAGNSSAINSAKQHNIDNLCISFLPLDYAWLRNRLFRAVKPKLLILMETEFWPNLLKTAHQFNVPVTILQARFSQSSRRNYPKYGQPLIRELLEPVALVAAQTKADANLLVQLGVKSQNCHLLGNIKYDLSLSPQLESQSIDLIKRLGNRWIWTAGSTHASEENPLIEAHLGLEESIHSPLLILVPRHPSYFEELARRLENMNIKFKRWSQWYQSHDDLEASVQVLLVDTLGQLMLCYKVAQVCFVGGSLVPWGGHNLLEPSALSKPIIAGPHNHNFSEIEQGLKLAQALIIVNNKEDLWTQLLTFHQQPSYAITRGLNANSYFLKQQGATRNIIHAISHFIEN